MPRKSSYVSPIDEKRIAETLRALRKRRGLTQVEIAERLGISQSLYSEYERGALRLHGGLVAGLAKALRASADEILCLKASKNGEPHDQRFVRRLKKIDQLSRRDKQILLGTIDAFLSKVS